MGAASSGRIPNAYLFAGANPQSLLDEAIFFAGVLNCSAGPGSVREGGCGKCESCDKIKRRIHPDVLIISSSVRQGKSIKIDEIRQISSFVRFGPALSRWKLIIMEDADLMTEEASNSFLKTLEEPHKNVLFILLTTRETNILKTIVSRCQKIMFPNMEVKADDSADQLADKLTGAEKMSIPSLLALSDELSALPDLEGTLNSAIYKYGEKVDYRQEKKYVAVREIFEAVRSLERRANKRLTLDNMLLSLKEVEKD